MRELKFRAWDKKQKKMLYGVSIGTLRVWDENAPFLSNEFSYSEDCVFEQYTGLKDNHGKEIYEGDIVKVLGLCSSVYQCDSGEWVLPHFYKEDDPISSLIFHCDKGQIEIIGNIHEYPELLEKEDAGN